MIWSMTEWNSLYNTRDEMEIILGILSGLVLISLSNDLPVPSLHTHEDGWRSCDLLGKERWSAKNNIYELNFSNQTIQIADIIQ